MENLTKENFFDELYERYPLGMKVFCDWVDEYKKRVDWDRVFNGGLTTCVRAYDGNGYDPNGETHAPKFHHLPLAIQIGIWIEFLTETHRLPYRIDLVNTDWRANIKAWIIKLQLEHEHSI